MAKVRTALENTALSSRELACLIIDREGYFLSESSVYRILKSYDLITSPAYILLSASDSFKHPTWRVHETPGRRKELWATLVADLILEVCVDVNIKTRPGCILTEAMWVTPYSISQSVTPRP